MSQELDLIGAIVMVRGRYSVVKLHCSPLSHNQANVACFSESICVRACWSLCHVWLKPETSASVALQTELVLVDLMLNLSWLPGRGEAIA